MTGQERYYWDKRLGIIVDNLNPRHGLFVGHDVAEKVMEERIAALNAQKDNSDEDLIHVFEGFRELCDAVGIETDMFDGDDGFPECFRNGLVYIANSLKPYRSKRDEDTGDLVMDNSANEELTEELRSMCKQIMRECKPTEASETRTIPTWFLNDILSALNKGADALTGSQP